MAAITQAKAASANERHLTFIGGDVIRRTRHQKIAISKGALVASKRAKSAATAAGVSRNRRFETII